MLAPADVQKGEGSAAVDARRKELAAQRAATGLRGAKQFYRVTVRVSLLTICIVYGHVLSCWRPMIQRH